jgi:hypothetical protein
MARPTSPDRRVCAAQSDVAAGVQRVRMVLHYGRVVGIRSVQHPFTVHYIAFGDRRPLDRDTRGGAGSDVRRPDGTRSPTGGHE